MRRRVPIAEYEKAVLLALYDFATRKPETGVYFDKAHEVVGLGAQLVSACLIELEGKKFIETFNWSGRLAARMTRNGFQTVDSWSDEQHSKLYRVLKPEIGDSDYQEDMEIPASDRVVTLDHNQSDYQQAVEALDKVLEEFRADHRLDNELGPLKEAHLKVLEGGRKALEDKEISVENGRNWIVAPLKWIAEKYAGGTVTAAAVEALKWVLKLLGLGN